MSVKTRGAAERIASETSPALSPRPKPTNQSTDLFAPRSLSNARRREEVDGRLEEIDGDLIIVKDKQESNERWSQQVEQQAQAGALARRPSILGRLRSGSVTAVSGEDAAAEALRTLTNQLTVVKTKKNPLVRLKSLLSYCIAVAGPSEVRAFSAQMSNLMMTAVLLLYVYYYGNIMGQIEISILSFSLLVSTVISFSNAQKRSLKKCNFFLGSLAWTLSITASVLKDAIEEVGKHYTFCRLNLQHVNQNRCDLRQIHAAYKGSFGLATAIIGVYCFYLVLCCKDDLENERTVRDIKAKLVSKLSASPRKSVMKRFSISGKGNGPPPMRRMSLVASES